MRKTIVSPNVTSEVPHRAWLDVEQLAAVEVTSEEAGHPIEAALRLEDHPHEWRAREGGPQTIRLRFDTPQRLQSIRLVFDEAERARTHEFVLRWQAPNESMSRDLVRQQYTFSPPTTTREIEEYTVDLDAVSVLELQIVPDISDRDAKASLAEWRLA
jgi:hypothetical protein